MQLKNIVEAILFAAEKPLSIKELKDIFLGAGEGEFSSEQSRAFQKIKDRDLLDAIQELNEGYDGDGSGLQIREVADAHQLVSRPEYIPWLRRLFAEHRPQRLSQPAMETLAIIAYRQPITRADIEAIRGVAADTVIQTLLERGLIKIAGRAEVPGRPLLYGTTQQFLEHFGLKNLDNLPAVEELRRATIAIPSAASAEPVSGQEDEFDDEDDEHEVEDEKDDEPAKT